MHAYQKWLVVVVSSLFGIVGWLFIFQQLRQASKPAARTVAQPAKVQPVRQQVRKSEQLREVTFVQEEVVPIAKPAPYRVVEPVATKPVSEDLSQWTHAELVARLKGRGLQFAVMALRESPPTVCLFFGDVSSPFAHDISVGAVQLVHLQGSQAVIAEKHGSEKARDRAGVYLNRAFAWGPFLFTGDVEYQKKIRLALTGG